MPHGVRGNPAGLNHTMGRVASFSGFAHGAWTFQLVAVEIDFYNVASSV